MKQKFLFFALIAALCVGACKKDEDDPKNPLTDDIENVNDNDWGDGSGFTKEEIAFGETEQKIALQRNKLEETGSELTKYLQFNQFNALYDAIYHFINECDKYDSDRVRVWMDDCLDNVTSALDNKSGRIDEEYTILGRYKKLLAAAQFRGKFTADGKKWKFEQADDLSFTMPSGSGVGNTTIKLTTNGKEKTVHAYDKQDKWYAGHHYKLVKKVEGYKGNRIQWGNETAYFRFPGDYWQEVKTPGYYTESYDYNTGVTTYTLVEKVDGLEKNENGYSTWYYDKDLDVYCNLLYPDGWYERYGVDVPGYYYGITEYETEDTEFWITLPEEIVASVIDGGTTLAEVTIKTDISKIKGDEIDLSRDGIISSVIIKAGDLEIRCTGNEVSPSKLGAVGIIKSNDKTILTYEVSADTKGISSNNGNLGSDYSEALNNTVDVFTEGGASISNVSCSLNILGKVQFKINCKDGKKTYDLFFEAFENNKDEAMFASCIEKANESFEGGMYFYGGSAKQAELYFEPIAGEYYDYDEHDYLERWIIQTVLKFSNGQTMSLDKYFDEDYFKSLIKLVNELSDSYNEKLND